MKFIKQQGALKLIEKEKHDVILKKIQQWGILKNEEGKNDFSNV